MHNYFDKNMKDLFSQFTKWVDDILKQYSSLSIPVIDFEFKRLPSFFTSSFLTSSKVVILDDNPPVPPLLNEFSEFTDFFKGNIIGITYKDTYFVMKEFSKDESLHFHELIHIIQWDYLGTENHLICYAMGLLEKGYRDSFLEDMAYRHQRNFDLYYEPYDVQDEVIKELKDIDIEELRLM